jgi:hypothetical protein
MVAYSFFFGSIIPWPEDQHKEVEEEKLEEGQLVC